MKVLILKKFWIFLLTLTALISLGINTNADLRNLIDPLTDDELGIILGALNSRFQVNWKRKFRLTDLSDRRKSLKVLNFLVAVNDTRKIRSDREILHYLEGFCAEENPESNPSKLLYKKFMEKRWKNKQYTLDLRDGALRGLWRNAVNESLESLKDIEHFLILNDDESTITSKEVRISQDSNILPLPLPPVTSVSLLPLSSSSSPSPSPFSLLLTASSSASSTVVSSTPSADVSDEAEGILSMLNEKSKKMLLYVRLNNFQIPFEEFNFRNPKEKNECEYICNYLQCILQKKRDNILKKKDRFLFDSPEHGFYANKQKKYEDIISGILVLFPKATTSFPSVSSSRSKSSRFSSFSSRDSGAHKWCALSQITFKL